ncbi:MAG: thioredoxin domain-containing protein [Candidatus Dadabacteria bacterium]|nr:thioredoxin domain-containing protein [Candidatus Dadabacteria bacterium]
MRFRLFHVFMLALCLFAMGGSVFAQNISPEDAKRLQIFIKRTLGTRVPEDAKIQVKGYEKSSLSGFKKGNFAIESSKGSGDVPFLISNDGRYLIFGEPIETQKFKDTPVAGLKEGKIPLGRQSFPVLMSKDGKYMILGELIDSKVNPLQETMKKISLNGVPVKGNTNAKVTIVEYSDFQCPFCKRGADMLPGILDQYKDKVKLVYKQLPLPNHNWAKGAAIASVCAYEQGNDKFWKYHDLLFQKQKEITLEKSKDQFNAFAKETGLNTAKFETCVNSPETASKVQNEMKEAQSVGVSSTPTFVVNGMIVQGANPDGLKSAIDASLSGNI